VVWAATAAFVALLAGWSILAPLTEAPDEPAHLALVLHLADGNGYPTFDGLENPVAIGRLCRTHAAATRACPREGEVVTRTSVRLHPLADAPNRATRPAWDDEGGDRPTGRLNQMPQHPPLYYHLMASVLRVERAVLGGPASLDRELALLRLANVALLAPLPLLAWWAAERFRAGRRVAVATAVAVLAVPMLTHIGSVLNNDNLLVLLGAVLAALLAGVARGDRSRATALAIGVVAGLALLTKASAIVFPPAILAAYGAGSIDAAAGAGRRVRALLEPLALAAVATVAVAGWWYLGVRSRTGTFTPTIESDRYTAALAPDGFRPDPGAFADELVGNLVVRFWGSFGWYSVRFWAPVAVAATVAVAALVVTALVPRRGVGASDRWQRASLLVPFVGLVAVVAARAWSLYAASSLFQFLQGRYLFPGIVGVLVLAAAGLARVAGRWAPVVAVGAAVLLQGEGVRRSLDVWWGGPGVGPLDQLRAMVAWGSWPGPVVAAGAVLGLGALLWFVVELGRELRANPTTAATSTPKPATSAANPA
jgi:small subunit ribosomal protein S36